MADEKFDPWRYCLVCKRHHDQGRSHIFTTKHKNKLKLIIDKYSKKVHSARRQLQSPEVVEGELEPEARLWCYCCSKDIARHVTDSLTTVAWGGLLEHMASPDHHKKTRYFWWVNGADNKLLQKFILFAAEYRRYKELVAEALARLVDLREEKLKKEAEQIKSKEEAQLFAASEPPQSSLDPPSPVHKTVVTKHGVLQNPTGRQEGNRVRGGVKYKNGADQLLTQPIDTLHTLSRDNSTGRGKSGKVTVAASSSQLTTIKLPKTTAEEGNIHSGATRPWLKDEEDLGASDPTFIGPSEEDFLKHKEKHKSKSHKNPRRVGADFHSRHRQQESDSEWLPSFGRVWNAGPRSHSLAEFQSEKSFSNVPVSTSNSRSYSYSSSHEGAGPSGMVWGPPATSEGGMEDIEMKPYVRKRKRRSE